MDITMNTLIPSNNNTMPTISTAVLNKSLETMETSGNNLIKMMEQSVNPHLGNEIDIRL